jgi:hypothetical protein
MVAVPHLCPALCFWSGFIAVTKMRSWGSGGREAVDGDEDFTGSWSLALGSCHQWVLPGGRADASGNPGFYVEFPQCQNKNSGS